MNPLNQLPKFLKNLDPEIYLSNNYVVLDFETTTDDRGSPYGRARLITAAWRVGNAHPLFARESTAVQFRRGSEFEQRELCDAVEQCDFIVAHHSKFEHGWLQRCGTEIGSKLAFCTQIADYVIGSNRNWKLSLDACLGRWGLEGKEIVVSKLITAGVNPEDIPAKWLEIYTKIDVNQTHNLFLRQRKHLLANGLLPVFYTRNLVTAPLVSLEQTGIHLDKQAVDELYKEHADRLLVLEKQLNEITGGANFKSVPQMNEVLFDRLKFEPPKDYKGNEIKTSSGEYYSTGKAAMAALKPKTKEQRQFIKLRTEAVKLKDAISKYLRHFKECIEEDDGFLYTDFNQTVTATQRFSATGKKHRVQFQNIDRRFKRAISSRYDNWSISEHDYPQLEFRVAANEAQDDKAIQKIQKGEDPHADTASVIFSNEWSKELSKERRGAIRTDAKPFTFKPLYGGSGGTRVQRRYFKWFRATYKRIVGWQEENFQQVKNTGTLTVNTGLKFYFKDAEYNSVGYFSHTTQVANYPVQNMAGAEIAQIGLVYQWYLIKAYNLKSMIINQVHDSVIAEVHPEEKEIYDKITRYSMNKLVIRYLKKVYGYEFVLDLEPEGKFSTHWGK